MSHNFLSIILCMSYIDNRLFKFFLIWQILFYFQFLYNYYRDMHPSIKDISFEAKIYMLYMST